MCEFNDDERVRGVVITKHVSFYSQDTFLFITKKNLHRIVELRRPGFFFDTSLLGRIHSITETFVDVARTTATTTTTTAPSYRDNPNSDSPIVDLTMSKLNDGATNNPNSITNTTTTTTTSPNSRRLR